MFLKEFIKVLDVSDSKTEGLASVQQLTDNTSDEIYIFKEITSETEDNVFIFPVSFKTKRKSIENKRKDVLEDFNSVIKSKLKKPVNLKKLYYEQFENNVS
jgi:hypothetical protein